MANKFEELVDQFVGAELPMTKASIGTPVILTAAQAVTRAIATVLAQYKIPPAVTGVAGWALMPLAARWTGKTCADLVGAAFGAQGLDAQFQATERMEAWIQKLIPDKETKGAVSEIPMFSYPAVTQATYTPATKSVANRIMGLV